MSASINSSIKWWFIISNFIPTYLKYKYIFYFISISGLIRIRNRNLFSTEPDPDPWKKMSDPHPCMTWNSKFLPSLSNLICPLWCTPAKVLDRWIIHLLSAAPVMDAKAWLHFNRADAIPTDYHREDRVRYRVQREEEDEHGRHVPGQGLSDSGHWEDVWRCSSAHREASQQAECISCRGISYSSRFSDVEISLRSGTFDTPSHT